MQTATILVLALPVAGYLSYRLLVRLRLSLAKHPSLRGHARWSRRIARLLPYYAFDDQTWFSSDAAPDDVAQRRRAALQRLRDAIRENSPRALNEYRELCRHVPDVRFTSAYRVPFPYREGLPAELRQGAVVDASSGSRIRDIDGNWRFDLSGAYGVNVFGYDFYKGCMREGMETVAELGPVLGPYHPLVSDNARRIAAIAGLADVSFHMSGTEAVMQAVRLARYHTGRSHLVRFCGAYHGWWDGVQPGVGNYRRVNDVYTLAEMSERTLGVLATRRDIACVLVNPLQALHPNADAPGDAALVNARQSAAFDRDSYSQWLRALRRVCSERGIVLIIDEVLTGFRLARGGAQEYFGVRADMVTYGKTLGGGLPVGVLCGTDGLMQRYRERAPADVSFARGTFNSHPAVMAAMNAFLCRLETDALRDIHEQSDAVWNYRFGRLNDALAEAGIPVSLAHLHSVATVRYHLPSRYHWMLQFYLRHHGLELSWVGTGRLIMYLGMPEADFDEILSRFVAACADMQADGWWWRSPELTERSIRARLVREMLSARFSRRGGTRGVLSGSITRAGG